MTTKAQVAKIKKPAIKNPNQATDFVIVNEFFKIFDLNQKPFPLFSIKSNGESSQTVNRKSALCAYFKCYFSGAFSFCFQHFIFGFKLFEFISESCFIITHCFTPLIDNINTIDNDIYHKSVHNNVVLSIPLFSNRENLASKGLMA